jgi:hypothetical protein
MKIASLISVAADTAFFVLATASNQAGKLPELQVSENGRHFITSISPK